MNQEKLETLQDQHLDMMLHLAFLQEEDEEIERLLNTPIPELTEEQEALTERAFQKAVACSERQRKAEAHRRHMATLRSVVRRGIEGAACLVVIVGIALPVAFATSSTFRSRVMQLLISYDQSKQEASFSFEEEPSLSFTVPEEWEGLYYLSYIPENFSMASCSTILPKVTYRDANGSDFIFSEYDDSLTSTLGTEGGEVSEVMIGAQEGHMVESHADGIHTIDLVWAVEDRWFHLSTLNMERDEVIRVAESVRRIVTE